MAVPRHLRDSFGAAGPAVHTATYQLSSDRRSGGRNRAVSTARRRDTRTDSPSSASGRALPAGKRKEERPHPVYRGWRRRWRRERTEYRSGLHELNRLGGSSWARKFSRCDCRACIRCILQCPGRAHFRTRAASHPRFGAIQWVHDAISECQRYVAGRVSCRSR